MQGKVVLGQGVGPDSLSPPCAGELETFEGDKQPEVDPQPVFGEDLVACVQVKLPARSGSWHNCRTYS